MFDIQDTLYDFKKISIWELNYYFLEKGRNLRILRAKQIFLH